MIHMCAACLFLVATSLGAPLHLDQEAVEYLTRYGYINDGTTSNQLQSFELSLKAFQTFVGLKPTGKMDEITHEMMNTPRCGMKDIHNSDYYRWKRFTTLGKIWQKRALTYAITIYPNLPTSAVDQVIAQALGTWSLVSTLAFRRASRNERADIKLAFVGGDHLDGDPFDGVGGDLAHAFRPQIGEVHFDIAEPWSIRCKEGQDLYSTAVHELGHALGLGHSNIRDSVMFPYFKGYNPYFSLHPDDITGIQELYGKRTQNILYDAGPYYVKDLKIPEEKCILSSNGYHSYPTFVTIFVTSIILSFGAI